MKHIKIPKTYTEYFCQKTDIIICEYINNKNCPKSCNLFREIPKQRFRPYEQLGRKMRWIVDNVLGRTYWDSHVQIYNKQGGLENNLQDER